MPAVPHTIGAWCVLRVLGKRILGPLSCWGKKRDDYQSTPIQKLTAAMMTADMTITAMSLVSREGMRFVDSLML